MKQIRLIKHSLSLLGSGETAPILKASTLANRDLRLADHHASTTVVDTPESDTKARSTAAITPLDLSTKEVPRSLAQAHRMDIAGAYTLTGQPKL